MLADREENTVERHLTCH